MPTFQVKHKNFDCYIEFTLSILGGKWKSLILWNLKDGTMRYNELRKLMPACTQRMLIRQLRELERDGIVARKIYGEVPPRVEYSLTDRGELLKPMLDLACNWGIARVKELNAGRA